MENLIIPTFLLRGTSENAEAIARGRKILAARPRLPKTPTSPSWASTGYRKPKPKFRCTESTRHILHSLGWSDKVIERLSMKAANQYADGGIKMQPTHEVNE